MDRKKNMHIIHGHIPERKERTHSFRWIHRWYPNASPSLCRSDYQYSSEKKPPMEHESADMDSYEIDCGSNMDPEIAALMNKPMRDSSHENRLLREGGWKCGCGKVHPAYVFSCSCGRNKHGDEEAKAEQKQISSEMERAASIREYKKLMDEGIITAEEFEAKKKQLLNL
jgi:hypothetical protein